MKLGIWVIRPPDDYGSPFIEDDDSTIECMSVVVTKIGDSQHAYYTAEQYAAHAKIYADQSIDILGWDVVRGNDARYAAVEGAQLAQMTSLVNRSAIVDVEPDPNLYWHGVPGTPRALVEAALANGLINLRVCIDARNAGTNLGEWEGLRREYPQLNISFLPMVYWTEFRQSMVNGIEAGIAPLLAAGVPISAIWPVLPTYDVSGPVASPAFAPMLPDYMEAQLRYVAARGFPGASLYRRYYLSRAAADRVAAMPDVFAPNQPQPGPDVPPSNLPSVAELTTMLTTGLNYIQNGAAGLLRHILELEGK